MSLEIQEKYEIFVKNYLFPGVIMEALDDEDDVTMTWQLRVKFGDGSYAYLTLEDVRAIYNLMSELEEKRLEALKKITTAGRGPRKK
jgi:hypothetical protein